MASYKVKASVAKFMAEAEVLKAGQNIGFGKGFDVFTRGGWLPFPRYVLDLPISFGAKILYVVFLDYRWHNDFCIPGKKLLAKRMGIGERQVYGLTVELKKAGLIVPEHRGFKQTNRYHFVLPSGLTRKKEG